MYRLSLVVVLVFLFNGGFGQVFWSEDFGTDNCAVSEVIADFTSANGNWTFWNNPDPTANSAQGNTWYVSALEAGMGEGACGDGCEIDATLTNKTLHIGIGVNVFGDMGASYSTSGLGVTNTDTRVETPTIDCSGQSEIELSFLYMAGGTADDICILQYFDGTDWLDIGVLPQTPTNCLPQGTWASYSTALPASANNNPDVKIGFRWINLDPIGGGLAVQLSVAIDDITLTSGAEAEVTADFEANATTVCAGDCVDFTDLSLGDDINAWNWTFTGAETATSTEQNPLGICYTTPGQYSVTLAIESPDATDELTLTNYITVEECAGPPVANFTANLQNICVGDCVDFSDLSLGEDITDWSWTFTGADTPASTDQNPGGICFSTAGSFDVTLSVTNAEGTDEITIPDFITVNDCTGPVAGFSASETTICVGDCIDFTNESIGGATIFAWVFEGADTPASIVENPLGICYSTPGVYEVSLMVSDGTQNDQLVETAYITVEECASGTEPELNISASSIAACPGDCIDFQDMTINGTADSWFWVFEGGDPAIASTQNPTQICYSAEGTYDVTLSVTIDGQTYDSTFVDFITIIGSCGPVASFDFPPIVCLGQCYSFDNTSTGVNANTSYFWTFQGALPETSTEKSPAEVCYLDQTGTFNVTLTVTNQLGASHSVTQQITVVNSPSVNAGPDQTIVQGTTTVVSATGGNGTGQFSWEPYEDVLCFNCPSTTTVPLQETTDFIVFYEQSGGCRGSDTLTVHINDVVYTADVPTTFSPNGDGVNDIFYVHGNNITKVNLIVYNRYGQEVFSTNSTRKIDGWDGTMNGRELNAGVFGYYLEAHFSDGTSSIKKGDITLVR